MNITAEKLQDTIQDLVATYCTEVQDAQNAVIQEVCDECVEELKRTSPVGNGKGRGQYARNWKHKVTLNRARQYVETVYNQGQYRLTHLLEYGHDLVSKNGKLYGRTKAIPHIKPAEEHAIENYERELKKVLNDIK